MNSNLLSNKELENYTIDDSFNFKAKADAIKYFLELNSTSLEKNKMLVLYGDWGSGKTSLMKHIESEIDKNIYFPIFFRAWEHEKDENLPLSLCDLLINSISEETQAIKEFMKGALITLKSFASGITLKSSSLLPGMEFEFSGEKVIKAVDKAFEKAPPTSFYKSNEDFKKSFKNVEDLILKKKNAQKILIFVDDLDRCEPENVLNLITALKLFFTYGDKCVFLSGIDKEAVTKAVRTRYKDVIKSEEYMEKVFDIAFSMPKTFSLRKLLEPHFFDFPTQSAIVDLNNSVDILEDFFKTIRFTNPRHLKKTLNKYEIIRSFKTSPNLPTNFKSLIPNIIEDTKSGNIFETIYCLFFIILYEFYPSEFEAVENYKQKMINYTDILFKTREGTENIHNNSKGSAAIAVKNYIELKNLGELSLNSILNNTDVVGENPKAFSKFLFIFSHNSPSSLNYIYDHELDNGVYEQYFDDELISTRFCKFLIKYSTFIVEETKSSEYIIINLFALVKYLS